MNLSLEIFLDAAGSMFDPLFALVRETGSDGDADYTPTWGKLFDVTQCPTEDLPYLAQYVGVAIPTTASDGAARQLIQAEAGLNRGTVASIRSAIERNISTEWAPTTTFLSGTMVAYQPTPGVTAYYIVNTTFTSGTAFDATNMSPVDPTSQYQFYERATATLAPDAYQIAIVVGSAQLTPAGDDTALLADIANVKPAGILVNVLIGGAGSPLVSQYTRNMSAITAQLALAQLADVT